MTNDDSQNAPPALTGKAMGRGGAKPAAYCALRADGTHNTPVLPGQIYFFVRPEHGDAPIPKDQEAARQELETFSSVLRVVFFGENKGLFDEYFDRLLTISQGVFMPTGFRPEPLNDLESFKNEIVNRAGGKVKADYLARMAMSCGVAALIFFGLSVGLHFIEFYARGAKLVPPDAAGMRMSILNTGILLAMSMLGLFFASCIRNMDFTFETLVTPDADLAHPWVRVVFYAIAILTMALLFQSKMVTVAIGNVSTAEIAGSALTAGVVGLLLGVAERAIPKEVIRWSGEFLKKSQPK